MKDSNSGLRKEDGVVRAVRTHAPCRLDVLEPRQEAPGFDVMPIHNAEFNGPFGRMRSFGQTEQFLSETFAQRKR